MNVDGTVGGLKTLAGPLYDLPGRVAHLDEAIAGVCFAAPKASCSNYSKAVAKASSICKSCLSVGLSSCVLACLLFLVYCYPRNVEIVHASGRRASSQRTMTMPQTAQHESLRDFD
jgi:hypothetical protein